MLARRMVTDRTHRLTAQAMPGRVPRAIQSNVPTIET